MLNNMVCLISVIAVLFFVSMPTYAFDFYKGRYLGGGVYSSLLGGGFGGASFFEIGWKQTPSYSFAVGFGSNSLTRVSDTDDFVARKFTMLTFSHYQPTEVWEWKRDVFWENSFSVGFADYTFMYAASGLEWVFGDIRFSVGGGLSLNSGEGVEKYDDLGSFGLEIYSRIKLFNL